VLGAIVSMQHRVPADQRRSLLGWKALVCANALVLILILLPTIACIALFTRVTERTGGMESTGVGYRWQDLEAMPEGNLIYPGCVVTGQRRENAHREWTTSFPTMVGYGCLSADDARQLWVWYHEQLLGRGWHDDPIQAGYSTGGAFWFGWSRGDYHLRVLVSADATPRDGVVWEQLPGQAYSYGIELSAAHATP